VADALDDDRRPRKLRPGDSLLSTPRRATRSSAIPRPGRGISCWKRFRTSATRTSVAHRQIEQIRDAVELPFLQRSSTGSTRCGRPRRAAVSPPGCARRSSPDASRCKKMAEVRGEDTREASRIPQHQGSRAAQTVRRRDRAAHPLDLPAARRRRRGTPVIVFFDEMDSIFRPRHRRQL